MVCETDENADSNIIAGDVIISGLSAGTYILVETMAPDGYMPKYNPVSVVIDDTGNVAYDGMDDINESNSSVHAFPVDDMLNLSITWTDLNGNVVYSWTRENYENNANNDDQSVLNELKAGDYTVRFQVTQSENSDAISEGETYALQLDWPDSKELSSEIKSGFLQMLSKEYYTHEKGDSGVYFTAKFTVDDSGLMSFDFSHYEKSFMTNLTFKVTLSESDGADDNNENESGNDTAKNKVVQIVNYQEVIEEKEETANVGIDDETESESKSESETETKNESETESESESGTNSELQSESQSDTKTESQTETEKERETETETESESETEMQLIFTSGTVAWYDKENADGIRPTDITIRLLADGVDVDSVTVSESNDWTFEFDDLPKYGENDAEIIYTIAEDMAEGYTAISSGYNVAYSHVTDATEENANGLDLTIHKIDKNGDGLSGAKFRLMNSDGEYYVFDNSKNEIEWVDNKDESSRIESGKDGRLVFYGLQDGSYSLKETAAPDGYKTLDDTIDFIVEDAVIAAISEMEDVCVDEDGKTIEVCNYITVLLPSAGGNGAVTYAAAGLVLMSVAFATRRKYVN